MCLGQLRVDRRRSFNPATGHTDVEQAQVGRVAESRGDRTLPCALLRADDEPTVLEHEPNAHPCRNIVVSDHHTGRLRVARAYTAISVSATIRLESCTAGKGHRADVLLSRIRLMMPVEAFAVLPSEHRRG